MHKLSLNHFNHLKLHSAELDNELLGSALNTLTKARPSLTKRSRYNHKYAIKDQAGIQIWTEVGSLHLLVLMRLQMLISRPPDGPFSLPQESIYP